MKFSCVLLVEIISKATQTMAAVTKLKAILKEKNVYLKSEIRFLHALTFSVFLYICKSWTFTTEPEHRVHVLEMRCY